MASSASLSNDSIDRRGSTGTTRAQRGDDARNSASDGSNSGGRVQGSNSGTRETQGDDARNGGSGGSSSGGGVQGSNSGTRETQGLSQEELRALPVPDSMSMMDGSDDEEERPREGRQAKRQRVRDISRGPEDADNAHPMAGGTTGGAASSSQNRVPAVGLTDEGRGSAPANARSMAHAGHTLTTSLSASAVQPTGETGCASRREPVAAAGGAGHAGSSALHVHDSAPATPRVGAARVQSLFIVQCSLTEGTRFPIVGDARTTWEQATKRVCEVASGGYVLRVKAKQRMYAGANAITKGSVRGNRYTSYDVNCQCKGPYTPKKHVNPVLWRKTHSIKTGCPAMISMRWSQDDERQGLGPRISKIDLRHNHPAPLPDGEGDADSDQVNSNMTKKKKLVLAFQKYGISNFDQQHNGMEGGESKAQEKEVENSKPKILLCLSGSVGVVKAPQLAVMLREFAQVKIVVTEASKHAMDRSRAYNLQAYTAYTALDPPIPMFDDRHEWSSWDAVGDPILHIQLRDWADLLLVAPLSANALGKLANGLCDNLVTSIARAWDFRNNKLFVVAPAMNTHMWEHPMTDRHLAVLKELGVVVVPPTSKALTCGDKGIGTLATVEDICKVAMDRCGVRPTPR